VAASTPFIRSFLRNAWAEAQAANQTLLAKLSALNAAAVVSMGSGKVLQSTSGNGRSVTFQVNASEGVTPTDIVEMMDRLLNLYDAAVAAGNATDSTRYTFMLSKLKAVTSFRGDYSQMLR
jgi:hypothetical protein